MRGQEEGEPVDAFITALYSLAEHCGYRALHDEMIRDRIVVGIRNAQLAEKLQLDSDLTLETAYHLCSDGLESITIEYVGWRIIQMTGNVHYVSNNLNSLQH